MVAERDSLSTRTTTLEAQIAQLQADTARIHHALADFQGKYNVLNESYSQANKNLDKTSSNFSKLDVKKTMDSLDKAVNNLKNIFARRLIYRKKIPPVLSHQLNLNISVHPELITKFCIQLPAKLVIFYRAYNTYQPAVIKKIFREPVYV